MVLDLEHFDRLSGEPEAHTGIGNIAKMLHDQAAEGFRAFQRKRGTQLAIENAQRRHSVYYNTSIGLALKDIRAAGSLRRELSHDFFQDVLERDQSEQFAVFVDH